MTLFGSGGVGKTSLILRFVRHFFSERLTATVGTNFMLKDLDVGGVPVQLVIWDIGGQARFESLRQTYFKGTNGALGVFDLTKPETLEDIPGWIDSIQAVVNDPGLPVFLLGNKVDLPRAIPREQAVVRAEELGCGYLETSAKTGESVEEAFGAVAAKCLERAREVFGAE
ncbi:MAG: Rab family GTPase [Promethearchaeota archaeon]